MSYYYDSEDGASTALSFDQWTVASRSTVNIMHQDDDNSDDDNNNSQHYNTTTTTTTNDDEPSQSQSLVLPVMHRRCSNELRIDGQGLQRQQRGLLTGYHHFSSPPPTNVYAANNDDDDDDNDDEDAVDYQAIHTSTMKTTTATSPASGRTKASAGDNMLLSSFLRQNNYCQNNLSTRNMMMISTGTTTGSGGGGGDGVDDDDESAVSSVGFYSAVAGAMGTQHNSSYFLQSPSLSKDDDTNDDDDKKNIKEEIVEQDHVDEPAVVLTSPLPSPSPRNRLITKLPFLSPARRNNSHHSSNNNSSSNGDDAVDNTISNDNKETKKEAITASGITASFVSSSLDDVKQVEVPIAADESKAPLLLLPVASDTNHNGGDVNSSSCSTTDEKEHHNNIITNEIIKNDNKKCITINNVKDGLLNESDNALIVVEEDDKNIYTKKPSSAAVATATVTATTTTTTVVGAPDSTISLYERLEIMERDLINEKEKTYILKKENDELTNDYHDIIDEQRDMEYQITNITNENIILKNQINKLKQELETLQEHLFSYTTSESTRLLVVESKVEDQTKHIQRRLQNTLKDKYMMEEHMRHLTTELDNTHTAAERILFEKNNIEFYMKQLIKHMNKCTCQEPLVYNSGTTTSNISSCVDNNNNKGTRTRRSLPEFLLKGAVLGVVSNTKTSSTLKGNSNTMLARSQHGGGGGGGTITARSNRTRRNSSVFSQEGGQTGTARKRLSFVGFGSSMLHNSMTNEALVHVAAARPVDSTAENQKKCGHPSENEVIADNNKKRNSSKTCEEVSSSQELDMTDTLLNEMNASSSSTGGNDDSLSRESNPKGTSPSSSTSRQTWKDQLQNFLSFNDAPTSSISTDQSKINRRHSSTDNNEGDDAIDATTVDEVVACHLELDEPTLLCRNHSNNSKKKSRTASTTLYESIEEEAEGDAFSCVTDDEDDLIAKKEDDDKEGDLATEAAAAAAAAAASSSLVEAEKEEEDIVKSAVMDLAKELGTPFGQDASDQEQALREVLLMSSIALANDNNPNEHERSDELLEDKILRSSNTGAVVPSMLSCLNEEPSKIAANDDNNNNNTNQTQTQTKKKATGYARWSNDITSGTMEESSNSEDNLSLNDDNDDDGSILSDESSGTWFPEDNETVIKKETTANTYTTTISSCMQPTTTKKYAIGQRTTTTAAVVTATAAAASCNNAIDETTNVEEEENSSKASLETTTRRLSKFSFFNRSNRGITLHQSLPGLNMKRSPVA